MRRDNPLTIKYARILLAAALTTVAVLSLVPSPPEPPGVLSWDKLQHACAYALLALLFYSAAFPCFGSCVDILLSAFFAWLYGALIELLQMLMPYGRAAELTDLVANLAGVLAACLLLALIRFRDHRSCHET